MLLWEDGDKIVRRSGTIQRGKQGREIRENIAEWQKCTLYRSENRLPSLIPRLPMHLVFSCATLLLLHQTTIHNASLLLNEIHAENKHKMQTQKCQSNKHADVNEPSRQPTKWWDGGRTNGVDGRSKGYRHVRREALQYSLLGSKKRISSDKKMMTTR